MEDHLKQCVPDDPIERAKQGLPTPASPSAVEADAD